MTDLFAFTVIGLVIGSAYAIAASGLVVTYATSNVFNMAHGAIGMVMAFVFWELSVNRGLPTVVALVLVVGVIAPLFGALIERTMMRRLTDAPVAVSLVVTVGLMVGLIGLAQSLWPPSGRRVDEFFAGSGVQLGEVLVSAHELITFSLAALVAGGLYYLLNHTKIGTAMRAIVDNRDLVALHGARPKLLGSLSWALGSALAALAGILLVPEISLDYITLTLLVVNAYAAAMVGRLKNLPRTFVGAMLLGLLQSYFLLGLRYLPDDLELGGLITGFRGALPTIFLFVTMLLLPQVKLRVGKVSGTVLPRVPTWRRVAAASAGLLVAVAVLTMVLSRANTARLGQSLALATIMLSLVVLTGYGGDVSLGQMTFVGVGAVVTARMFGTASPTAMLLAGVVAAAVGAIVAIPALRIRGLYLGLGTLAFAVAMDKVVFQSELLGFGGLGGSIVMERPTLLGVSLESEQAFTIFVTVGFLALAAFVLALRRGRFGRFLLASRDSEVACATLGFSTVRVRVLVFAISAGMAGIGGALFSGMQVSVGTSDFRMFQSLPLLLLAVVGGVTSVSGALIGGLLLGMLPLLQEAFPALGGLVFVLIGVAAVSLGRNPNGIASWAFMLGRRLRGDRTADPRARPADAASGGTVDRDEEVAHLVTT